jgi:hypothetical protein
VGVRPLAPVDVLVVDETEDPLIVLAVELELLPPIHQLHRQEVAKVEVTVLCLLLATVSHHTEPLGLGRDVTHLVLVHVHLLAVPELPVVLLLLLRQEVELHRSGLEWRVILRLNCAILLVEVQFDGRLLFLVQLLDLVE